MSPQVMNLGAQARLLFIGLITQADDAGRSSADPRRLKAAIFGGDDCTSADVRRWLDEVAAQGLAVVYDGGSHGLLYELPSWRSHQSIDRPRPSTYPAPTAASVAPASTSAQRTIVEASPKAREGSEGSEGREGNGTEGSQCARAREPAPAPVPEVAPVLPRRGAMPDTAWLAHWTLIRAGYPTGAGRQDWIGAERLARRLVDEGVATAEDLMAGVRRYGAHCAATGRLVLNPARFFGDADLPWAQPWPIPAPRSSGVMTDPAALAAWDALIATEGASRQDDPRAAKACESIGGWLAVKGRTDRNARRLRDDFCRAWSAAPAGVAA